MDNLDFTDPAAFSSFANAGRVILQVQRDGRASASRPSISILRYAEVLNFAEAKIELWAMGAEDGDDRIAR